MFSLFRRTAQHVGQASAIADMERHSGFYQMAGPSEAAWFRANAAITFDIVAHFAEKASIPEDLFENKRPLKAGESAQVSVYISIAYDALAPVAATPHDAEQVHRR